MISKPSLEIRQAIQSLTYHPEVKGDFVSLLNWVQSLLTEQRKQNDNLTDLIMIGRGQGCAQTLQELLDCIDENDKVMEQLRQKRKDSV